MTTTSSTTRYLCTGLALAGAFWCFGCIWEREDRGRADLGVAREARGTPGEELFRDCIGAYCYFDGMDSLPVRGFGLVIGLQQNGSRDCPKKIREQLIEALYKRHRISSARVDAERIVPERLVDSLDTAVVMVQAGIPPAAIAGTHFDIAVKALPGTQTKSLRGGRLHVIDLHRFRTKGPGASITGKCLARAAGPVFLNPFSDDESATKANPREGIVLGGGTVLEDRLIRLILLEPSYSLAIRIRDRINAQFPGAQLVADAISRGTIELRIPREFVQETGHFLALVRSLYLSRDPRFEAARALMLAEEMVKEGAKHGQISLCLEGLGRPALALLSDLYAGGNEAVSFHSAVAGVRLGDHIACDAVEIHARSPHGEYRFQAIRALADAKGMGSAAMALRKLLHDPDPRVAIAAYEALLKRGDRSISSKRVAGDNFLLDRAGGRRNGFIYAKRSGSQRIALFGEDLRCLPPLFYRAPDGVVTITADYGDEQLTVLRVVLPSGRTSPPIPAPLELFALTELLGNDAAVNDADEVIGLGLDYGTVVRALYNLCKERSVNARFILEQPNALEIFGQPQRTGRPESEP